MKKLATTLVLALFFLSCKSVKINGELQENNAISQIDNPNVGLFKTENGKYINSATYLKSGYGHAALHSVENINTIEVQFGDELILAHIIKVVHRTEHNDGIVLLKFERKPKYAKELEIYAQRFEIGEVILISGFPRGCPEKRVTQLLHIEDDKLFLTEGIEGGMSGGLAQNHLGHVVGITLEYIIKKDNETFFNYYKFPGTKISIVIDGYHINAAIEQELNVYSYVLN